MRGPTKSPFGPGLTVDTLEIARAIANATAADDEDGDDAADDEGPGALLLAAQGVVRFRQLRKAARGADGRIALTPDVLRRVVEGDGVEFSNALGRLRAALGGDVDEDAGRLVMTVGVLRYARPLIGPSRREMRDGDEPREDGPRFVKLPASLLSALFDLVRGLHDGPTGSTGHRKAGAMLEIPFDTLIFAPWPNAACAATRSRRFCAGIEAHRERRRTPERRCRSP